MILTLTVNPALDLYSRVPSLVAGDKMRCEEATKDPGGGGVNVSRVIKRLGGDSVAIYTRGGYTGDFYHHLLEQEGISQEPVEISGALRQNVAITALDTGELYRFGFPGPELSQTECSDVLNKLNLYKKAEYWVASGSLPPGVPTDFYAQVAAKAKAHDTRFILDTSGQAYQGILEEGAFLLKPNMKELEDLTGQKAPDDRSRNEMLLQVLADYPVEVIVLSLGAEGAVLATQGKVVHFPAPSVEHISSIGAGDSMVAGIVYSLAEGKDLREAVLYGLACGSATIKSPGTELLRKTDVDPLYRGLLDKLSTK